MLPCAICTRAEVGADIEVPIDSTLLERMEAATWRIGGGGGDVLLGIPRNARWELVRYEELRDRGERIEPGELRIAVAGLDNIIWMRRSRFRVATGILAPPTTVSHRADSTFASQTPIDQRTCLGISRGLSRDGRGRRRRRSAAPGEASE